MVREGEYLKINCAYCDEKTWKIPVVMGSQEKECDECGYTTKISFDYIDEVDMFYMNVLIY